MTMNVTTSYLKCALVIMLFSSFRTQNEKVSESAKPNIIWIIAEDLSPDFNFNGNLALQSPFVDSLASIGKYYSGMYATGVACSPSRTAFATGYYQNTIGAHHMRYPEHLKPALPDSILPVHVRLMEVGYQTANITSFPGNGKTDWQFDYPAQSYDHDEWKDINPDKPFFVRINLRLTHRPFESDPARPVDPASIVLPPYIPDHEVSRKDWVDYFESIQVLDGQIATIVNEIRQNGLGKNTLIFFFSDHGRPMSRAKNYLYDSGLNVPLIVFSLDENLTENYELYGEETGLFSLIDVSKTALELGEVTTVKTQGRSVLGDSGRDYLWAAADRIGEVFFKSRMIRNSKFKYIRNYNHNFSINEATTAYTKANYPVYHLYNALSEHGKLLPIQQQILEQMEPEELYDLESDPYEVNNLFKNTSYLEVLEQMRTQLDQVTVSINDMGLKTDSESIIRAFDQYGDDSYRSQKSKIEKLKYEVSQTID